MCFMLQGQEQQKLSAERKRKSLPAESRGHEYHSNWWRQRCLHWGVKAAQESFSFTMALKKQVEILAESKRKKGKKKPTWFCLILKQFLNISDRFSFDKMTPKKGLEELCCSLNLLVQQTQHNSSMLSSHKHKFCLMNKPHYLKWHEF